MKKYVLRLLFWMPLMYVAVAFIQWDINWIPTEDMGVLSRYTYLVAVAGCSFLIPTMPWEK